MATRMQQRRGLAAQWISSNDGDGPILNAGEIGFETDTNKFKIGDGSSYWADLPYFADVDAIGGSIDDYVPLTQKGAANGVAELDAEGKLKSAQIPNIEEITQDILDTSLVAGTGLDKTYNDNANTYTMDIDSTVATLTGTQTLTGKTLTSPVISGLTISDGSIVIEGATGNDFETTLTVTDPTADRTITFPDAGGTVALTTDITVSASSTNTFSNKSISLASNTVTGTTAEFNTALSDSNFVTTGDTGTVTSTMISDGTIVDGDINAAAAIAQSKIANLTTDLGLKAPLADPTFTGTVTLPTGTVTSGMILDGTIVNADINASAAIAQSKVDGLTTDLAAKLALAGGTMTGAIAMGTNKITGLGTPTDSTDAATKAYVDAVTEGLHIHPSVVAATTANVTLESALENGDTLDGVTLATGNRILVKNQTTQSENGIYVVAASGAPSRATDFDSPAEIDGGDFVFVTSGTVNDNTGWVQVNTVGTVGTDSIVFTQFSGAGTYTAGNGLTLTGSVFSIDTTITQARVADVSDTEIGYLNGVTSAIQTQLDGKIAKADISAKGAILVGTGSGTYTAQSVGSNGQVLTANSGQEDGVEWTTISSYSAPTLGSTSIGSGATVTTIAGLTSVTSTGFTGALTGNASTATALQTPRAINGVNFDGSAAITVTAAAGTLSGSTLASGVTASSLTSVGTLSSLAVTGNVVYHIATNAQAGAYSLVTADDGRIVEMSGGGTLTVPSDGGTFVVPVGSQITIIQTGATQVTIAGSGATVNGTPGLKLRAQWSSATLIKRSANTWVAVGDLSA
jgi:hypothetical protein